MVVVVVIPKDRIEEWEGIKRTGMGEVVEEVVVEEVVVEELVVEEVVVEELVVEEAVVERVVEEAEAIMGEARETHQERVQGETNQRSQLTDTNRRVQTNGPRNSLNCSKDSSGKKSGRQSGCSG